MVSPVVRHRRQRGVIGRSRADELRIPRDALSDRVKVIENRDGFVQSVLSQSTVAGIRDGDR